MRVCLRDRFRGACGVCIGLLGVVICSIPSMYSYGSGDVGVHGVASGPLGISVSLLSRLGVCLIGESGVCACVSMKLSMKPSTCASMKPSMRPSVKPSMKPSRVSVRVGSCPFVSISLLLDGMGWVCGVSCAPISLYLRLYVSLGGRREGWTCVSAMEGVSVFCVVSVLDAMGVLSGSRLGVCSSGGGGLHVVTGLMYVSIGVGVWWCCAWVGRGVGVWGVCWALVVCVAGLK